MRPRIAVLLLLVIGLAGCNSNPIRDLNPFKVLDAPPTLDDIQSAFEQTGRSLIAALHSLMNRAPREDSLDYQTAITVEAARLAPTHIADRGEFYQAADRLEKLVDHAPQGQIPKDTAVMAMLADMAAGRAETKYHLSELEAERVVRLCGPNHVAERIGAADNEAERLLRQACFTWLLGDGPKSRALLHYVRAQHPENTSAREYETAFDLFMQRLNTDTGINLLAHRTRLSGESGDSDLVAITTQVAKKRFVAERKRRAVTD